MATKKNVKVRDLKPTKDAKGGSRRTVPNSAGVNSKSVNKHHGHNNN